MMFSGVFPLLTLLGLVQAQSYYGPEDPRIGIALTLDVPSTGVSRTPDGRLFVIYARVDGSTGPAIVEYNQTDNSTSPFPDLRWNSYTDGDDPANYFVHINSQRIGPDGALWLVDTGDAGSGVITPGGPKLIQIDLQTNQVVRTISMDNVTFSNSLLDDVRFNPATGKAYLTDAGVPALIVLDVATGVASRILENHLSTKEYLPISAEGTLLHSDGGFSYIYADQLEVSPDGTWLYFQPASGGMSRVPTVYVDQALYNTSFGDGPLASYVEPYAHTPSTGGTAIDSVGNIYTSDTDSQRIIKILPNGTMTLLTQDPRLLWVDAMWIDSQNRLWMPAAQINRGEDFNNGTSHIVKPLYVYTIDIGVGPSLTDHA